MSVPFVDLKAQYRAIRDEVRSEMEEVLSNAQFIGGDKLARFERNFAGYVESTNAVGTSSGTTALHVALEALGVGEGDEVITACNTFIATTSAITHTGARPVLVDVLPDTLNIDPQKLEDAITPKTKVIVPVHLYGQPADMDAVRDIASRHDLIIVADAAQAHGARYKNSRKGVHGVVSCYSFYPAKNLGAFGDAGAVVTDDEEIAASMRRLIDHGRIDKYRHAEDGYNYRMDTLQAVVLDVKLRHLDAWTESRRSRAARYDAAFKGGPVCPLTPSSDCYHVYHLYIVQTRDRDRLLEALRARGIGAGIHYPVPLHLQDAYERLGYKKGDFPVAERAADEIISLPMYAELTDAQVDEVVAAVRDILG